MVKVFNQGPEKLKNKSIFRNSLGVFKQVTSSQPNLPVCLIDVVWIKWKDTYTQVWSEHL